MTELTKLSDDELIDAMSDKIFNWMKEAGNLKINSFPEYYKSMHIVDEYKAELKRRLDKLRKLEKLEN